MYVCHIEVRSRDRFCRGKAVSITYSECVSVALIAKHVKRMRLIVICGLPCCAVFFYIIS
jgi:hypothetical protein